MNAWSGRMTGNSPLSIEAEAVLAVFAPGGLYNRNDLRNRLKDRGVVFSDDSVITTAVRELISRRRVVVLRKSSGGKNRELQVWKLA